MHLQPELDRLEKPWINNFKQCLFWRRILNSHVTAYTYIEKAIRDGLVSWLFAPLIQQRILENKKLTLTAAGNQARSVESAIRNSEAYSTDTKQVIKHPRYRNPKITL